MTHFKESGSGVRIITSEGFSKTLEELVDEEAGEELKESIKHDHVQFYNKPFKYKSKDKPRKRESVTKIYSRKEINQMQWEQLVEKAVSKNDMTSAIIGALLSGKSFTRDEMVNEIKRISPEVDERQVTNRFTYLYDSNKCIFGKLMESKPDKGLKKRHKLSDIGMQLTPEELNIVYYGKVQREDLNVLYELHPQLKEVLENNLPKEKRMDTTLYEEKEEKNLPSTSNVVQQAVKEQPDVNIKISGRVEVVFKLKLS